jgi:hypothetical protein
MKKKTEDKFKSIEPFKDAIIHEFFVAGVTNISLISRKFDSPYSTLRRFLNEEKKIRQQEDIDDEDFFNVQDFDYLGVGDTYQWSDTTKVWRVSGKTIKESEEVFVLVPCKVKAHTHWVCRERAA